MKIDILTLFPEMFAPLKQSILGRAQTAGAIEITETDIRDYSKDKHKKCDDTPFGGGAGMLMTVQPIYDCVMSVDPNHEAHRIFVSPKGERLCASLVKELAQKDRILIICGHYEGVDQRAIDLCVDREISIGDYVLTGGELAAMVITDAVARFVPGVLGSEESAQDESFSNDRLEYPQYTRPQEFMGLKVPEVLLSGHHANIEKWRREQSEIITDKRRPDLKEKKNGN